MEVGERERVGGMASPVMNAVESSVEEGVFHGGGDMEKNWQGRQRDYGSDGTMLFSLTSPSLFSPKRGRGRPRGTGKRQLLAALGDWIAGTAGGSFLPHVVTIAAGVDVAERIMSFSRKGPRSICILSANGAISNVTLRQPGSSGGTLTYEGRFEILSLSGSFTASDTGGGRGRSGGISVSLASPDGRVIGGAVAGLLLAASPIQLIVGSFMPNKEHKRKHNADKAAPSAIPTSGVLTVARPISQADPEDDTSVTPNSGLRQQSHGDAENSSSNTQNAHSTSFNTVGWHGSQSTSDQRTSPDINISLPRE